MDAGQQRKQDAPREKILNLPGAVTTLAMTFIAIHALVVYGPEQLAQTIFDSFAFIPARFAFQFDPNAVLGRLATIRDHSPIEMSRIARALNTGFAAYFSPLSYAFLHGDWAHLSVNVLSLTAFGPPVARRLGTSLFLAFAGVCAIAGAMTHFALHVYDLNPVIGASAAISGTMGAIARFAFTPGSRLSGERVHGSGLFDIDPRIVPLSRLGANRQAMLFVSIWLGLNFLLGAFPQAAGVSGSIAWEAHFGGFVFGLLFFGFFDRAARNAV